MSDSGDVSKPARQQGLDPFDDPTPWHESPPARWQQVARMLATTHLGEQDVAGVEPVVGRQIIRMSNYSP